MTKVEKYAGKRGVTITEDKHGIELMTMRNGFQWMGALLDEELLIMLEAAIAEFKEKRANVEGNRPPRTDAGQE